LNLDNVLTGISKNPVDIIFHILILHYPLCADIVLVQNYASLKL
jgi:hypothetical protein